MPGGNGRQKILVFEQNGKAATKIKGILEYGGGMFDVEVISVDADLPPVIEDSGEFIPSEFEADLVLDYLVHPDLSHDLGLICRKRNIPDAASGKKVPIKGVFTPPTCCGLVRDDSLGRYGELFGSPELKVEIFEGSIREIEVVRGAPCGATWKACENIVGLPVEDALTRIGLETQFHCTADPSNWDPIHGKSPVHFAGHVHKAALKKALQILESKDGRTGNIKI